MYEAFYGLKEKPFNMTPDPEYLFFSDKHKEAFAHLVYGIKERRGFIEITGEVGAGKTTLCRALLNEFEENVKIALILNPFLSDIELLKSINEELFIDSSGDSKKALLDRLNEFLIDQHSKGGNVVLVLDEAQNIHPQTLEQIRIISNLETAKTKLIQIILVGQPELHDKLNKSELRQLAQRINVRYHISALNRRETRDYIYHRLRVAGAEDDIVFTKDALSEIYDFSRGIPRKINVICDQALLCGYVIESYTITKAIVKQARKELSDDPQIFKNTYAEKTRKTNLLIGLLTVCLLAGFFLYGDNVILGTYQIIYNNYLNSYSKNDNINKQMPQKRQKNKRIKTKKSLIASASFENKLPITKLTSTPTETLIPTSTETAIPPTATLEEPTLTPTYTNTSTSSPTTTPTETYTITPTKTSIPIQTETISLPTPTLKNEINTNNAFDNNNIFRVSSDSDCEDASILTLLNIWTKKGFSLSQLWKSEQSERHRLLLEHITRSNYKISTITGNIARLQRLNMPAALQIYQSKESEPKWIILFGFQDDQLIIADPIIGKKLIAKQELDIIWYGRTMIITEANAFSNRLVYPDARGDEVVQLQKDLSKLGYFKGTATGFFGNTTKNALIEFQKSHKLEPDGILGPETCLALYSDLRGNNIPRLVFNDNRNGKTPSEER